MASTFTAAFEEIAGEEFDLAVGYEFPRREAAPVRVEVAQAWTGATMREFRRVAEQLVRIVAGTNIYEAEDAVQDALEILWIKRPDIWSEDPKKIVGLVSEYARKRLMKIRERRGRMLSLDLTSDPKSDADPEREGTATLAELTPAVAHTKAGVDEDARYTAPPPPKHSWERLQAIGAAQRFRDRTGRAPRAAEFNSAHGLPSLQTVTALGWSGLRDFLLETGIPIDTPERTRRRWLDKEAAEACLRFRRREGFWPNGEDARQEPGELPGGSTMNLLFGGSSPGVVQIACERILGPIDNPPPDQPAEGKLTATLRAAVGAVAPAPLPVV